MKALAAERICKFSDVLCQPRHGQLCGYRNVGLTVTTHVRTHDAIVAREYGHPFVEPARIPIAAAAGTTFQADATDRCNRR